MNKLIFFAIAVMASLALVFWLGNEGYLSFIPFLQKQHQVTQQPSLPLDDTLNDALKNGTKQFYRDQFPATKEVHWYQMPITYSILPQCTDLITLRMRWALDILMNESGRAVRFVESENESEMLTIACTPELPLQGEYIQQGVGSHTRVGNRIIKGNITFYNIRLGTYHAGCLNYPNVELHELLHTFGFPHSGNRSSILYEEMSSCSLKLDVDIVENLKKQYTVQT